MGKFEDLTGQKFGRLTVIKRAGTQNGHSTWLCRCECGNFCTVKGIHLKNGHTRSCGCLHNEGNHKTHGMKNTPIYGTWHTMMARCYNPKHKFFDRYGGRGIKVCERWHDINNFFEDVSQMENYGRAGYTLDRENNDKDYCPENCRWADKKTQSRNRCDNVKVIYEGEEMTLVEAAERSGIHPRTLNSRYHAGKSGEELFKPVKK